METAAQRLKALVDSSPIRRVGVLAWRDLDDPEAGGSEVHADQIFRRWAVAGVELTQRTSFAAGHPQVGTRNGYRVIRKAGRYMVFPRAAVSQRLGWHGNSDVVLEIWNGMPFFSPVWSKVPVVTWLHHVHAEMWQMTLPPRLARFGNLIESRIAPPRYRNVPIVTLSESSRTELIQDLGFSADRVTVVPPGIEARFSPGIDRSPVPEILAVGRLVPVKQFDRLMRVVAPLREQHPDLQLRIVGEGYEREALEQLRTSMGAEGWIHFAGRVSDDDLLKAYRSAWIVASSSAREGWGMTLTEAAACGTPCVATDIAGHRDATVHGVAGLLVDSDSAFTAALDTLLGDVQYRETLGRGALQHASNLTWDHTALRTFEALDRAVSQR